MIDTHAHLLNEFFDNIDEIIKESNKNGIIKIINCADDIKSSYEIIKISKKNNNYILPAIGIHPNNITNEWEKEIIELENIIKSEKIIAIGEIGLDYYHNSENKNYQKKLFQKQIDLATKYNLPILIHSREATQDTLNILKNKKVKGIIHCFTGSLETSKEYIKLGYYLGIGGVLTFKNAKISEVIKEIPLEYIVLETDSPFLTPHPFRGKQNTPSYLHLIAEKIAEIKNISTNEVIEQTTKNVSKLFNL